MEMSGSISQMLILPTHLDFFKYKTLNSVRFKNNFHVIAMNWVFPSYTIECDSSTRFTEYKTMVLYSS